ncbi:uncharacterized protein LOC121864872 [Homarus americanus]|uniref:uncharacterized protein LOC121864872 n=1 Tax=Homarus americanus TaxID=6706 RepID=UPI001C44ED92|nr:uncharacterized protein LOC121864872 [Homarus americanus]
MKWLIFALTLGVLSLVEGRDALDARIVAARSTKTAFFITTSTTVTPFTCAFATQGDVCQKRRYRRYSHINDRQLELDNNEIQASLNGMLDREERDVDDRDPRLALTFWTTVSSSYTVTTTSVDTGTTFSLSFFCTVNGVVYPPGC